ncbi:methionine--tRNA ligase [Desulfitibacter alkalitolerans]|uniref:methionine--tRNA ligase n=1 Tax=Desulfitibacter alkalitolerans TaxID=264641 RepID=UPI00047F9686|nr:methionine--tRNA ligase [Desulfitibacter alkalitolerans]
MSNKERFYVTTPIYYPSDRLHIGHALTTTMADTLARYNRLQGKEVWFLTGSDEHGQKIQRKAEDAGLTPIEYVDKIVATFQHLWEQLDIQYDDFIRTSEDRHKEVVQYIFKKIYDKGDIYKSEYEGWYCTPCETFWAQRQLGEEKVCPDCSRPVELLKEESYFFKMGKYAHRLLEFIENNPEFIQPVTRKNEMVNFIKQGLEDLCVSRTTFKWGIPVPIDERHVIYVWFDALTNYISALGYSKENDELFQKFWPSAIHLVGKDIVRFHTIIWPIILMAADIPLPKKVFGHGWLLVGGGKMSKSKGNVVDPLVLVDKYGSDAIRYFLLREMPYGSDGYYSEEVLIERINTDLANDFGNLLSRSTAMINKFCGGSVPIPGKLEAIDEELKKMALELPDKVDKFLDKIQFNGALEEIWKIINRANKYIDETAPWALAKGEDTGERLSTVLYTLIEVIRFVTILIKPFMPKTPDKVWDQLGISDKKEIQTWDSLGQWGLMPAATRINRGEALFPRLDKEEMLQASQAAESTASQPVEERKIEIQPEISIEDFMKVDLRVAEVLEAQKVEKADKLLKLKLKVGNEERTVVAGIAKYYEPEKLVGKKVAFVANLKPAKLRGIMSQGMVLAASDDDGLALLIPDKDMASGSKIK